MWSESLNPYDQYHNQKYLDNFKEKQLQKNEFMDSVKRIAENAEKLSESSKIQSDIAVKTSKKADIKGWIAVIVSVIGLSIEIITNFSEISLFISGLF